MTFTSLLAFFEPCTCTSKLAMVSLRCVSLFTILGSERLALAFVE